MQNLESLYASAGSPSRSRVFLKCVLHELAGKTERLLYEEHTQAVHTVAWSPDGKLVASAGDGGKLHFCSADAAAHGMLFGWYNDTLSLSWSPDGRRISSLSSGGGVQTWEVESGILMQNVTLDLRVKAFAWSPDGSALAILGGKEQGRLCIVDLASGKALIEEVLDGDPILLAWSLSWSSDGQHLATANGMGQVIVWDVSSPSLLQTQWHFPWRILVVAFSPQGNQIALGGARGSIDVWSIGEGQQCGSFAGHGADVRWLSWSPSGVFLASTAADGTLRIWHASTGKQMLCHQGAGAFGRPLWSPSSSAVACANRDGSIHVAAWDGQVWLPSAIYLGHLGCSVPDTGLAFSPDGGRLASAARELRIDARNFAVHVWHPPASTPECLASCPLHGAGEILADFAPAGPLVAGTADKLFPRCSMCEDPGV